MSHLVGFLTNEGSGDGWLSTSAGASGFWMGCVATLGSWPAELIGGSGGDWAGGGWKGEGLVSEGWAVEASEMWKEISNFTGMLDDFLLLN